MFKLISRILMLLIVAFATPTGNGRNEHGGPVGSGVYFARLKSTSGNRSYKLVLLK